jgi:hypothetical protein
MKATARHLSASISRQSYLIIGRNTPSTNIKQQARGTPARRKGYDRLQKRHTSRRRSRQACKRGTPAGGGHTAKDYKGGTTGCKGGTAGMNSKEDTSRRPHHTSGHNSKIPRTEAADLRQLHAITSRQCVVIGVGGGSLNSS